MAIIIAIIAFLLVVLVHEFGHFIVAKLTNVKVNEFSIGMGPKIVSRKKGETQYSLRAIPIGGYVQMEGEDESSEDDRGFSNKSVPVRLLILLAGAFMNFILALGILIICFLIIGSPTTTVGEVLTDSPAEIAGIKANDKIMSIGNVKIDTWEDITKEIAKYKDTEIGIKIERSGVEEELKLTPILNKEDQVLIGVSTKTEVSLGYSIKNSVDVFGSIIKEMTGFIGQLLGGKVSGNDVAGPIGIINILGEASRAGIANVLLMVALISINVGFFNLIPFPGLDGGRMLLLIIEGIRGKKLDPEKEGFVHLLGILVLLGLMVLVTFKDVAKLLD